MPTGPIALPPDLTSPRPVASEVALVAVTGLLGLVVIVLAVVGVLLLL
jgi:hypothetical protein